MPRNLQRYYGAGYLHFITTGCYQRSFYDVVVFSEEKLVEKLRYMHYNPVARRLVLAREQWNWSYRHSAASEPGPVLVDEPQKAELRARKIAG